MNDLLLIRQLEEFIVKDFRDACARNTNLCAKPKASDTKTTWNHDRVFGNLS